jgi:hypothetical protein
VERLLVHVFMFKVCIVNICLSCTFLSDKFTVMAYFFIEAVVICTSVCFPDNLNFLSSC